MAFFSHFRKMLTTWISVNKESPSFIYGAFFLAASRLFQLAAFFLPLKILILVSSTVKPSYMQLLPFDLELNDAVVMFSCLVPIVYIMYMVSGVISRRSFDYSQAVFIEKSKIDSKDKKANKLKKMHVHIGKAASEFILISLSMILVSLASFSTALILLVMLTITLAFMFKVAIFMKDGDRTYYFKLHRKQCIEYATSANFILVFVAILIQVMYLKMGVIIAIYVLLISRMLFQALQRYCIELMYIDTGLLGYDKR